MEVLDKVYNTFKNLDRDYSKSKKTRTEFIEGKFGGDIDIGSIIILEAIGSEEPTSPEDIKKFAFIKDTFNAIRRNRKRLESLPNFASIGKDFSEFESLKELLYKSIGDGQKQWKCTQQQLQKRSDKQSLHYYVTPEGTYYSDLNEVNVFRVYNEHIAALLQESLNMRIKPELDSYLEKKSKNHAVVISEGRARKLLG